MLRRKGLHSQKSLGGDWSARTTQACELALKGKMGRISIVIKREARASGRAGSNISQFHRTQKKNYHVRSTDF